MNTDQVETGPEFSLIRVPGFAQRHRHAFVVRGTKRTTLFKPGSVPRQEICDAAGLNGATLHLARQVHGASVVEFPLTGTPAGDPEPQEADALITRHAGHAVGVATADCLPILLATSGGDCAAVHAGWKGLLAGVIEAAARELKDGGLGGQAPRRGGAGRPPDPRGQPTDLGSETWPRGGRGDDAPETGWIEAAIGPSIGSCCFEVGPEVAQGFLARFPKNRGCLRPAPASGRSLVDLQLAAILSLEQIGVDRGRIRCVEVCTRCGSDLLESYRRDGDSAGRMIALIGQP